MTSLSRSVTNVHMKNYWLHEHGEESAAIFLFRSVTLGDYTPGAALVRKVAMMYMADA